MSEETDNQIFELCSRKINFGFEICTFESERKWINKARSWLINYSSEEITLVDSDGYICVNGRDMAMAKYPVVAYFNIGPKRKNTAVKEGVE